MPQESHALPEAVRGFITPASKKMLIGGKWVDAVSGKTFITVNPATAEPLAQVAEGDAADIDRAVAAARKAFDEGPWPHEKPAQRTKVLLKIAELIDKHSDELAQLETLDNGKTIFRVTQRRYSRRGGNVPLLCRLADQDLWRDESV